MASSVYTYVFKMVCVKMGSNFKSLLLHTYVRWLSRGKVSTQLYELRITDIEILLKNKNLILSN